MRLCCRAFLCSRAQLGPRPEMEATDDLAFWVAGLINPCMPALGVAREVRPDVLEEAEPLARLRLVHAALVDSIERLQSMPPGPFEAEPPPGIPSE